MQRQLKNKSSGLSLLELVVAVLVLSLGALAATRATDQSRLAIGGAEARVLAQIVATNRVEELHLYGEAASLPQSVTMAGQVFSIQTVQETTAGGLVRTQVTARSQSGAGVIFVAYLPAPQIGQP